MKVETVPLHLYTTDPTVDLYERVQVVRLADHQAALDDVLDKAVMYAQWLVQITDGESDENQDARAFLNSQAVQDWRARQKATSETK